LIKLPVEKNQSFEVDSYHRILAGVIMYVREYHTPDTLFID